MTDQTYTAKQIADITGKHKTSITRRAQKESWQYVNGNGKGGNNVKYPLASLPSDIQSAILLYDDKSYTNKDTENPPRGNSAGTIEPNGRLLDQLAVVSPAAASTVLDALAPANPLEVFGFPANYGNLMAAAAQPIAINENSINHFDLQNNKFCARMAILRDMEGMPVSWKLGRRKWVESVAAKHRVSWQQCYRMEGKVKAKGLVALRHTNASKNQPKKWTPEAIDYWCGLVLKREHRKMDRKILYAELVIEANRRGWEIGTVESASWWYHKKVTPLMAAYAKGGMLALDNLLPPVLRDYSDLAPFEILVGDQHRFDFWCIDDDTLQTVRPECYLWVDLRTRIAYGIATDRKYDAHLMAQALRHGLKSWGAFGSIFTDNGKPELSKHITSILATMRSLGLEWAQTIDVPMDVIDYDGDEVNPCVLMPGTHKKAVVKNAKSKLIERYFQEVERALVNFIRLPGYVKDLHGDIHEQDVDQAEVKALSEKGRLPYLSEFAAMAMQACYYLNQQHHRGVAREWIWGEKPARTSPLDCLVACCNDGWRSRFLTTDAIDALLMKREKRIVNKGRVQYQNDWYEHDALLDHHGEHVAVGSDPLGEDVLLVFLGSQYLCTATPVSYSSMKEMGIARQKIVQKRERRSRIALQVREMTAGLPDLRNYPESNLERSAAQIADDRRAREIEHKEKNRPLTQVELDEGVRQLEVLNRLPVAKKAVAVPPRPGSWISDAYRHQWCIQAAVAGVITEEDRAWMMNHEAQMSPSARERWEFERGYQSAEAGQL
jgi:putative transposase